MAPGRVPGTVEPKGKEPLSTVAIFRAGADRPHLVSKPRPDAQETLRIVLARLDDMKAEDVTTIDLRKRFPFDGLHGRDLRAGRTAMWARLRIACSKTFARPG